LNNHNTERKALDHSALFSTVIDAERI